MSDIIERLHAATSSEPTVDEALRGPWLYAEAAAEITRLRALLKRTHIVLGLLTDDMHDEDIPPQVHALIADVRHIVREELARTPPQGQGEAK